MLRNVCQSPGFDYSVQCTVNRLEIYLPLPFMRPDESVDLVIAATVGNLNME